MRHPAVSGVEECGYRRTSCNHGLLVRSSSDSDLAVVTAGYAGSLDVEAYEEAEEEDDEDSENDRDDDDDCMEAENNQQEQLPYPGFVPIAMKYLDQKSRPRNWCLAMITNPYPFYRNINIYNLQLRRAIQIICILCMRKLLLL